MSKKLLVLLIFLSLAGISAKNHEGGHHCKSGKCSHHGGHGHMGFAHHVLKMAKKLELTDGQKSSIEKISKTFQTKRKTLRKSRRESMKIIHAELKKLEPDESKINNETDKLATIQKDLIKAALEEKKEVKSVLNEKQLASLK